MKSALVLILDPFFVTLCFSVNAFYEIAGKHDELISRKWQGSKPRVSSGSEAQEDQKLRISQKGHGEIELLYLDDW